MGRPSLAPGRYFRLLLVGYFEGIDSERDDCVPAATDSLAVRSFLRSGPWTRRHPIIRWIARTRRLIDLETPDRTVFTWVQQRLVEAGRLKGKTIAIAPRRSRRTRRCAASSAGTPARATKRFWRVSRRPRGSMTPTREGLAPGSGSGRSRDLELDWTHPHDPDAKRSRR